MREGAADVCVGRDAATEDERLCAGLFQRSRRFLPQHLGDGVFKFARDVLFLVRSDIRFLF